MRSHDQDSPAILARSIERRLGPSFALRGVDIELPRGQIGLILGANGAGKTTLLETLAGLHKADAGLLEILGHRLPDEANKVRASSAWLGHTDLGYPALSGRQNLQFHAALRGLEDVDRRISDALAGQSLERHADRSLSDYSRGMRQRLDLARAQIHDPQILFLDEPFSGLDAASCQSLADNLKALRDAGRGALLSSHRLEPSLDIADRLFLMDEGRCLWQGTPFEIDLELLKRGLLEPAVWRGLDRPAALTKPDRDYNPRSAEEGDSEPRGALDRSKSRPAILQPAKTIFLKDIKTEIRARELVPPVLLFAFVALIVLQLGLPAGKQGLPTPGAAGAIWAGLIFASTIGLSRFIGSEFDGGGIRGLLTSPIDRGSIFLGKFAAAWLMTFVSGLPILLASVIWFNVPPSSLPALSLLMMLGLVGWTALGVLMATLAAGSRARDVLLPILLLPAVVPLLMSLIPACENIIQTGSIGPDFVPSLMLIISFDMIFLVLGFLFLPIAIDN